MVPVLWAWLFSINIKFCQISGNAVTPVVSKVTLEALIPWVCSEELKLTDGDAVCLSDRGNQAKECSDTYARTFLLQSSCGPGSDFIRSFSMERTRLDGRSPKLFISRTRWTAQLALHS